MVEIIDYKDNIKVNENEDLNNKLNSTGLGAIVSIMWLNVSYFFVLFISFDNIIMKIICGILLEYYIYCTIVNKLGVRDTSILVWVFTGLSLFVFGFWSFAFLMGLFLVFFNYVYFKMFVVGKIRNELLK